MTKVKKVSSLRRKKIATQSVLMPEEGLSMFLRRAHHLKMEKLRLEDPQRWQALQVIECMNLRCQRTRS